MKNKKALKNSLSALICTVMLANPVMTAFATEMPGGVPRSPEITEEYLEGKIPAEFSLWQTSPVVDTDSDGNEFHGQSPYWGLKAHIRISVYTADKPENTEVESIDLGDFDTGTETSIIAGLPSVIRDKYGDRSKYNVTVFVKPLNLPDELVMSDDNYPYPLEEYPFAYNNENELRGEIHFRNKEVHTQTGVIHLKAPEKKEYKIGEELDLTGGEIRGSGGISNKQGTISNWDNLGRELTTDDLDLSGFDNTKPGEHLIKAKPVNYDNTSGCDELIDKIVYDGFYVTVIGNDESVSETETTKINFCLFFEGDVPEDLHEIEFSVSFDTDADGYGNNWIELGKFTPDENNIISVDVPSEYFDSDKYGEITFDVDSYDLVHYKGNYYEYESIISYYQMSNNTAEVIVCGPYDEDHYYNFYISCPPTKLTYNIGEELDLTGGLRKGSGHLPGNSGYWDDFGTPLTLDMLDTSEFDNTKPGVYTIKGKGKVSGEFKVTVVDKETETTDLPNIPTVKGDANCDEIVDISDAVLIMQSIANPSKYKLTDQGRKNADSDNNGVTSGDALAIQKTLLNLD